MQPWWAPRPIEVSGTRVGVESGVTRGPVRRPTDRVRPVRQLSSLDAQFLALETPRQSGHVGSVAILDPSTRQTGMLAAADIQALIAERLALLPPLRWRLQEVPLGLDYPYGLTTAISTWTFTSASSQSRRLGVTRSSPNRLRASSPARWIAHARCGSST